jgi:hypothetical protein
MNRGKGEGEGDWEMGNGEWVGPAGIHATGRGLWQGPGEILRIPAGAAALLKHGLGAWSRRKLK